MFRILNTAAVTLMIYSASGTMALAQSAAQGRGGRWWRWLYSNWSGHQHSGHSPRRAVPEIDAANGFLALAAVAAALALAYEINRRRKS